MMNEKIAGLIAACEPPSSLSAEDAESIWWTVRTEILDRNLRRRAYHAEYLALHPGVADQSYVGVLLRLLGERDPEISGFVERVQAQFFS